MGQESKNSHWRLSHSFSLQLILLALVLLSVPLIIYWQFNRSEREQFVLVGNAVAQTNEMLAALLRHHFEQFSKVPPTEMREALSHAAVGNTHVKILVRLKDADNFIYVASAPSVPKSYLDAERTYFIRSGIFSRLASSCDGTTNPNHKFANPVGQEEVLVAMTPVHVDGGCWVVMTSKSVSSVPPVSADLPIWERPVMLLAGSIYVVSTALVIWLLIYMGWSVRRFRNVARHIRLRGNHQLSFRRANTIPELAGVAEDFDALIDAMISSQSQIKEAAEEKSHALKAPLAVIAQSVEPIKRALTSEHTAALRSIHLIERSIGRLDALVSAYRDVEQAAADMVYPMHQSMNLSALLNAMLPTYEATLAAKGGRMAVSIVPGATVRAPEDIMEVVVENLLENALSFTSKGGLIGVNLYFENDMICLRVADQGPGVPLHNLPHIFERSVSFRDEQQNRAPDNLHNSAQHQGLGLWIVKRNVEGLGGKIIARNPARGGFEVIVCLPKEN